MLVYHWMTAQPLTVQTSTPMREAVDIMTQRRVRRLPVMEGERLVGIVSRTDVLRSSPADVNPLSPVARTLPAFARPVADCMTKNPLVVAPEDPIERAAQILRDKKIGALPVVRRHELVGIITESDLFRAFVAT